MPEHHSSQAYLVSRPSSWSAFPPVRREVITPNPKLKLLAQVREVMRLKHYSIRTKRSCTDWIKRYVHFHNPQSWEELNAGEQKIELFLTNEPYETNDTRRKSQVEQNLCGV